MDFVSNQEKQIREMLQTLGIQSVDALFEAIPQHMRVPKPTVDDGMSELEGMQRMEALASKNTFPLYTNYLGAGAYEHHVPALVQALCSKSEFLTSYTPYQAEASQGMLQIIFEFQSALCALTGMDVANASLYDGASACAEGLLMALRCNSGRSKVLIAQSLHPHYRGVIDQYLASHDIHVETIPVLQQGTLDLDYIDKHLDESTAAILLQSPNFLGLMEEVRAIAVKAKAKGALTVLAANPLAYGLFASAGDMGVDVAVGDGQPLGLSLMYGGPYVGYIACKQTFIRQLPGRLVGETVDTQGRRGFVLTLQAREQHIRREKATSNICTNQALAALACLITMLWYGKEGLRKLALTNFQRAAYLASRLTSIPGVTCLNKVLHFNEIVVKFPAPIEQVIKHFRAHQIEPGIVLERYFPHLKGHLLIAVTETKSKEQLDAYARVAGGMV